MTDEHGREVPATGPAATHDALAARDAPDDAAVDAAVGDRAPPSPPDVFARRRAELGLSLGDVANQLKFSARQIEALETGDFDRLPGGTFVRGMMRSYARLLKLEPAQILSQLTAAGAKPQIALEAAVSLRAPIPFSESGKHVNLVYTILSVAILAVVAFFAFEWYQENNGVGKRAFGRPVAVVSPSAAAPVLAPDDTPQNDARATSATATLPSAGASPLAQAAPRAEEKRAVQPAVPAVTTVGSGKRRIVLRFDAQSWVEIKAARGAILMSQLNPAGTEKTIEGDPPFELIIGNASRVRLTYNDQLVDLKPYFHVDVARLTLN